MSGIGASTYTGRWNKTGTKINYTAESLSLATLETLVNIDGVSSLTAFNYLKITFEEDIIYEVNQNDLAQNWFGPIHSLEERQFGTTIILNHSEKVIKIPSSVIKTEFNYLIPPEVVTSLEIEGPFNYIFDERFHNLLKKS